jgi:hypothetical protein
MIAHLYDKKWESSNGSLLRKVASVERLLGYERPGNEVKNRKLRVEMFRCSMKESRA